MICNRRGASPPGSITAALRVFVHQTMVQFCCRGVTGTTTAWISGCWLTAPSTKSLLGPRGGSRDAMALYNRRRSRDRKPGTAALQGEATRAYPAAFARIWRLSEQGEFQHMKLFAKKPIELLLAQASEEGEHTLKRGLGPFGLTMLGIGSIIGAGIFILTGQQAAVNAGPAILLSFVLAGFTCLFAALCYAELSSMIPVSGSAYTYAYATLGEFVAWIIAWDLIVEYLFAASTVVAGWSGHLKDLLDGFGMTIPSEWAGAPYSFDGKHFVRTGTILNMPAIGIVALMAGVLISGITESSFVNNIIVMLKVTIVIIVIAFGIAFINPDLWHPFIPKETVDAAGQHHFGAKGILTAAGVIFFAYIGFETVSTAAQEARNPQRTMPIGILASLGICTILYIAMSLVITGLAPYASLNNAHPVSAALSTHPQLLWLRQVVNIGVAVGLGSTILTLLYGQSRIFYSMSRDGLLPPFFGTLMKGRRTPWIGTIITAAFAALSA